VTHPTERPGLPLTGERTVPGIERENYWFRRHEVVYQWIAGRFDIDAASVVEAGCGEGYGAALLSRFGANVVALDYDNQSIDHVTNTYPDVTALSANLDSFPLPDSSADFVVSLQVLEHLWDLPKFLSEIRRVLRPGGTLIISTPNRTTFSPGVNRGEKPTNPFHVEEFDGEQIGEILTKADFNSVEVLGLFHGDRLQQDETESGALVERQVAAILAEDSWPPELLAEVSAVTTSDFDIRAQHEHCLDLIAVGRV
jgi:SAM-dependent methyltransferase